MSTGEAESGRPTVERLLVPLLLTMTVVTGGVDAVSILRLGHVFVANMTGNVVFLGFALAGSAGFSVTASLAALGFFLLGRGRGPGVDVVEPTETGRPSRLLRGRLVRHGRNRGRRDGRDRRPVHRERLLSVAMGWQNAVARRLAVPDLTTTVLTLTLTGLVADPADVRAPRSHTRRRLAAVAAMLIGAAGGALLVLQASTTWALGMAGALLVVAAVAAGSSQGELHPPAE